MNTNQYINKIKSLYRKYARAQGMGNYGIGLKAQRDYYQKLPPSEKSKYENALLAMSQSQDIETANIALYLCSGFADIFPTIWANRVKILATEMIESGLVPAHKDTTTYAILTLVLDYKIFPLIGFVRVFRDKVTGNFKQGILPIAEWELLYIQVSRILIKLSPNDFWQEFRMFHEDQDLLRLLNSDISGVILAWSSYGAVCYGIDWLFDLVVKYSDYPNQILRAQALSSIEKSFSIVASQKPMTSQSKDTFLGWAKEKLIG